MTKSIYAAIALLLIGIASIVPWADAQQNPNPVIIWCQDTSGNYAPCLAGNSIDYDTGGGTVNQGTVGIALPASGGPVAGGTSTNPIRTDPTGTTTQPVSGTVTVGTFPDNEPVNISQMNGVAVTMGNGVSGTGVQRVTIASDSTGQVTANAGTNLNTSSLLTTAAHDAAFGTAGTADAQVRSIQGIASMTPVQVQSNSANVATETTLASILTALQLIDDDQTGASVHYRTSAGTTEDEHEVKGSAGRLLSITATNTNAAVRYLRCANQVIGSTTPGTTGVYLGLAIPGAATGAGFTTNFGPTGLAFSTGLTCWLVTGAADTDVAEVAANEIKVIYSYK